MNHFDYTTQMFRSKEVSQGTSSPDVYAIGSSSSWFPEMAPSLNLEEIIINVFKWSLNNKKSFSSLTNAIGKQLESSAAPLVAKLMNSQQLMTLWWPAAGQRAADLFSSA